MNGLDRFINSMSDQDWSWWPFLHLRPPKDVTFTRGRVLLVIAHFAPMVGVILALLFWWMGETTVETKIGVGVASMVTLILGMYVAGRSWNRRARELKASK